MHDPEDNSGHHEGVCHACCAVGDLVSELDVVVVDPATVDYEDSIVGGDGALREEGGEDVAEETTDGVGGEDLVRG